GFWGGRAYGWHYDLMLVVMNLVIVTTGGGKLVILSGGSHAPAPLGRGPAARRHHRPGAAGAAPKRPTCISTPTGRCPSTRLHRRRAAPPIARTFPTRRIPSPIASARSHRPTPPAIGGPGKCRTSGSSTSGRTS